MAVMGVDEVRKVSETNRPEAVDHAVNNVSEEILSAAKNGFKSARVFVPFELVKDVEREFVSRGFKVKAVLCGDTNMQINWE